MWSGAIRVAGTEKSGPGAGFEELFKDRWCILTPSDKSTDDAVEKVAMMWRSAEMRIDTMTPEHHDKVMAAVSHLPHLIAYSIVGTVADLEGYEKKEIIKYSASGFRDFTRIAGSDPTMWPGYPVEQQGDNFGAYSALCGRLDCLGTQYPLGRGGQAF